MPTRRPEESVHGFDIVLKFTMTDNLLRYYQRLTTLSFGLKHTLFIKWS